MENQKQDDQDNLVGQLTPSLHQESARDLSATVQTVVLGRNLPGTNGILHTGGRGHGVFTANTDSVEEERPDVADDPAVLSDTPGGGKHEKTDKHDDGVLDETMATAQPVTENTDEDLTY